jgi:hypothetical protein
MDDIIREIIKIDSNAYEKKKQNEERMKEKKMRYEEQMKKYEEEKFNQGQQHNELLYQQIRELGEKENMVLEEKAKQTVLEIEKAYLKIEAELVEKVFEKLFVSEE